MKHVNQLYHGLCCFEKFPPFLLITSWTFPLNIQNFSQEFVLNRTDRIILASQNISTLLLENLVHPKGQRNFNLQEKF